MMMFDGDLSVSMLTDEIDAIAQVYEFFHGRLRYDPSLATDKASEASQSSSTNEPPPITRLFFICDDKTPHIISTFGNEKEIGCDNPDFPFTAAYHARIEISQ